MPSKPSVKKSAAKKSTKPAPKAATAKKVVSKKVSKPAAKKAVKSAAKTKAKPATKTASKAPAKTSTATKAAAPAKATKAAKPAATKKPAAKPKAPEPAATTKGKAKKDPKRRIDTPEIQEKIRELIKLAKEQEYLTYDDINEILPNDLVDPEDVEAIMERLRNMEFDIIDASEVDRFKDKKRDEDGNDEEEVKADQKLDILDDPVRMYLKQMGQVPLLTREQEVGNFQTHRGC